MNASADTDINITEALRERRDLAFALTPRRAATIKGIAEPVATFAAA